MNADDASPPSTTREAKTSGRWHACARLTSTSQRPIVLQ
jgi:hypothetical protein